MMRRGAWFGIHLLAFAAVHAAVNAFLLRGFAVPGALQFWRDAITGGKIPYYHEPGNWFVHPVWAVGLAVHGVLTFVPIGGAGKRGPQPEPARRPEAVARQPAESAPDAPPTHAGGTDGAAGSAGQHPAAVAVGGETAGAPSGPGSGEPGSRKAARAWWMVVFGGLTEIVWATGFKYPFIPSLVVVAALVLSFDLLIRAAGVLPVGTVYAVFTGIGTLGTTAVETVITGNIGAGKLLLILLLLAFIIGLKLSSGEEKTR